MKILFIGAMPTEINSFIKLYKCKMLCKIANFYPLYSSRYKSRSIYLLQTFVGDTNAGIAASLALKKINPDFVFKIGCVGGTSRGLKKNDIILPLGYFHSSAWITCSNKDDKPTVDSSKWQSIFGDKPCQVNKKNLGNLPFYFYTDKKLLNLYKHLLEELNIAYKQSHIGSSNIWFFDKKLMNHISRSILPSNTRIRNWCSDMESFSIALACFIFHKPFMGFYFVSSSDYDSNDDYDPKNIEKQTKDTILPITEKLIEKL